MPGDDDQTNETPTGDQPAASPEADSQPDGAEQQDDGDGDGDAAPDVEAAPPLAPETKLEADETTPPLAPETKLEADETTIRADERARVLAEIAEKAEREAAEKDEADRLRAEEEARVAAEEAERAQLETLSETDRAKLEAEKARAEAETAKREAEEAKAERDATKARADLLGELVEQGLKLQADGDVEALAIIRVKAKVAGGQSMREAVGELKAASPWLFRDGAAPTKPTNTGSEGGPRGQTVPAKPKAPENFDALKAQRGEVDRRIREMTRGGPKRRHPVH